jgi:hypothetical protein
MSEAPKPVGRTTTTVRPSDTPVTDSRLVYRKTEAGEAEILARAQGLSAAARRLIILIDGQRTLSELPSFARQGDVPELIRELESKGMIALAGIADLPSPEELAKRQQIEQSKLGGLKQALAGAFEKALGSDGIVLDARIADCINLEVFRRILREAIDTLQTKGQRDHAQALIRLARGLL